MNGTKKSATFNKVANVSIVFEIKAAVCITLPETDSTLSLFTSPHVQKMLIPLHKEHDICAHKTHYLQFSVINLFTENYLHFSTFTDRPPNLHETVQISRICFFLKTSSILFVVVPEAGRNSSTELCKFKKSNILQNHSEY